MQPERRHFPSVWGLLSVDSAAGLLRGGISSDQCHCGRPKTVVARHIEPHPIETVVNPINPVEPVDTIPIVEPVRQERIRMDQQRVEEIVREIMRRGEYNPGNVDNGRGHGNGHRNRIGMIEMIEMISLRYSDIPTYDGKGDAMPHTHLIEFEDFHIRNK